MADSKQFGRFTSGVPGLDTVLGGGFFDTGVYVCEGAAGAGKTILANQICFHQASQQRRSVYYTLLTEAHDRMMRFLGGLRFYDTAVVPEWVSYVSGFKVLEAEGLAGVLRNIRDTVANRKASLLVIDGLVSAEEIASNDTAFKKFLHEVQTVAGMYRCTVILLTNVEAAKRLQAEHTMVDGIIRLEAPVVRLKPQRTIDIIKFRGAGQIRGTHTLDISDAGVTVYPRIETQLVASPDRTAASMPRRAFGIPPLDRMLGGGVLCGSNTLVLGPSGIGKTLLGLHFVAAGIAAGERTLFFTFYEKPQELVARGERLGLAIEDAYQRGDFKIVWESSVEASLDRIGAHLIDAFDEMSPTRVVVDGMHGFQVTADPLERIQDFFAALAECSTSRGATMVFTSETADILGERRIQPPFSNASRMCQNMILMRFAELRGRLAKVLAVVKVRDGDFDPTLRAVTIGDRGIVVGEAIDGPHAMLSGFPIHARATHDGGAES